MGINDIMEQLESDIPYSCPPSAISRMPAVYTALAFSECRTQETYCIHLMMSTGSCREWIFPTGDMLNEACMCTESLNATLFCWYVMPSDGTCPKFSSVGSYMDPQKHTQVPQRAIDLYGCPPMELQYGRVHEALLIDYIRYLLVMKSHNIRFKVAPRWCFTLISAPWLYEKQLPISG